jgi:DNA-binding transcriptional MerR regulator
MPLTVSEIAHRLAIPERQAALRERIRHWTREGLVKPIGEKNPGTGRHRQYDESVLVDVAILDALARLGIQVRGLHAVLRQANELIETWAKESKETRDFGMIYLVISYDPILDEPKVTVNPASRRRPGRGGVYKMITHRYDVVSLYINISRIYRMIETGKGRF